MAGRRSDEAIIIVFLGCIAVICIGGIILLEAVADGTQSEALLTIGSLCVGALAGRISSPGGRENARSQRDEDVPDAFEIIGREATRQVIADALRKME